MAANSEFQHEDRGNWLRQVSEAVERKSFISRKATRRSIKLYEVAENAPKEYICPISLELMRDPVLLVETGQVYDRPSIEGWFKAGKSTCPVSGTKVKHMRLSPIFPLRSAIQAYAKDQDIELETAAESFSSDDTPKAESSAVAGTLFEGVSVFDVRGLAQLTTSEEVEHKATALNLLAEMSRFGDRWMKRKISSLISREKIVNIYKESEIEILRVNSARLLLNLPGKYFDLGQQISLLKLKNLALTEDILSKIWAYAYRHRARMLEVASSIASNGPDQIISVAKKIADPTENTDIPEEVRTLSCFLIACASFNKKAISSSIKHETVPLLVNLLNATPNPGLRFCLMKSLQYICEYVDGRAQVLRAGGVRIFVTHLPPRNKNIHYSTRVYVDWFSWVTVAETAVKALYYLAFEEQGRHEMRTTATLKALRFMVNNSSFPDNTRSRYLTPLLSQLV